MPLGPVRRMRLVDMLPPFPGCDDRPNVAGERVNLSLVLGCLPRPIAQLFSAELAGFVPITLHRRVTHERVTKERERATVNPGSDKFITARFTRTDPRIQQRIKISEPLGVQPATTTRCEGRLGDGHDSGSGDAQDAGFVDDFRADDVHDFHGGRHVVKRTVATFAGVREFEEDDGAAFEATEGGELKPRCDVAVVCEPVEGVTAWCGSENVSEVLLNIHGERAVHRVQFSGGARRHELVVTRGVSQAFPRHRDADATKATGRGAACQRGTRSIHVRDGRATSASAATTQGCAGSASDNREEQPLRAVHAGRVTKCGAFVEERLEVVVDFRFPRPANRAAVLRHGVLVFTPAEAFVPDVGAFRLQEQAEGIHVFLQAWHFAEVLHGPLERAVQHGALKVDRLLSWANNEVTSAAEDGRQVKGGVDCFAGHAGVQLPHVLRFALPRLNDAVSVSLRAFGGGATGLHFILSLVPRFLVVGAAEGVASCFVDRCVREQVDVVFFDLATVGHALERAAGFTESHNWSLQKWEARHMGGSRNMGCEWVYSAGAAALRNTRLGPTA